MPEQGASEAGSCARDRSNQEDKGLAYLRRLRDYLHDRDMVVAGRPLPEGTAIGSSQHGTASRGQ